jgi:hypothetical protein
MRMPTAATTAREATDYGPAIHGRTALVEREKRNQMCRFNPCCHAYGPGVPMDQYGQPVREQPWP